MVRNIEITLGTVFIILHGEQHNGNQHILRTQRHPQIYEGIIDEK